MSDLAKGMAAILSRSMVKDHFAIFHHASSIGATTHTGSVYLIDIKPGEPREFTYEGYNYLLRRGDVTINGELTEDISVGYNFDRGTFLVLDDADQMFRRSSSIDRIELLD